MRMLAKVLVLGVTAGLAALGLAACGGGGGGGGGGEGGTATVLMGTAPDYLDPQEAYTTQAAEADWISYTPLSPTRTRTAPAGNEVIPGLATALPQISADGKTYTLTLRKGLVFSDGQPVKASDFAYTVERVIKVQLGRQELLHRLHRGRRPPYDKGKADRHLRHHDRRRDGQDHDPARQALRRVHERARVPRAGPGAVRDADEKRLTTPPPGVGPYMITNIVPNQSFSVVKNPKLAALNIPDIPAGHLDDQRDDSSRTRRPRPSRCSTTRPTSSTPATRCRRRSCRRSSRRRATGSRRSRSRRRSTSS